MKQHQTDNPYEPQPVAQVMYTDRAAGALLYLPVGAKRKRHPSGDVGKLMHK